MAKAKTTKKSGKTKESANLKAVDLRGKTPDELKDLVLSIKKEQFNARFQKIAGEPANAGRTRTIRKNIARIKTVMNESKKVSKNA